MVNVSDKRARLFTSLSTAQNSHVGNLFYSQTGPFLYHKTQT